MGDAMELSLKLRMAENEIQEKEALLESLRTTVLKAVDDANDVREHNETLKSVQALLMERTSEAQAQAEQYLKERAEIAAENTRLHSMMRSLQAALAKAQEETAAAVARARMAPADSADAAAGSSVSTGAGGGGGALPVTASPPAAPAPKDSCPSTPGAAAKQPYESPSSVSSASIPMRSTTPSAPTPYSSRPASVSEGALGLSLPMSVPASKLPGHVTSMPRSKQTPPGGGAGFAAAPRRDDSDSGGDLNDSDGEEMFQDVTSLQEAREVLVAMRTKFRTALAHHKRLVAALRAEVHALKDDKAQREMAAFASQGGWSAAHHHGPGRPPSRASTASTASSGLPPTPADPPHRVAAHRKYGGASTHAAPGGDSGGGLLQPLLSTLLWPFVGGGSKRPSDFSRAHQILQL